MKGVPQLDRRVIPPMAAATLLGLSREIAGWAQSPFDPRLPAEVDARVGELGSVFAEVLAPPSDAGAALITGLTLSDDILGPTPPSWRHVGSRALFMDVALMLLGRCAGEPFAWQGQQNGRLVNNIVPTVGHEDEQTGASSNTLLSPHTEDAFHPRRANMLLLGCLRNPDRVGTTLSSIRHVRLDAPQRRLLSAPALPILPDISYGAVNTGASEATGKFSTATAPPISTLWTGDDGVTLRYDPAYTPLPQARAEFRSAYDHLTSELERVCVTAALAPGELLLIDNDVTVHGRVPFTARYDGTDRWLKRINIRLPSRLRNPAESTESGYGQRLVEPFANVVALR